MKSQPKQRSNAGGPIEIVKSMPLSALFKDNTQWLMHRILYYAQRQNFTLYTSTLPEAWRASIEGLNKSFEVYSQLHDDIPELDPDNDYSSDPVTDYGMSQARKH